MRQSIRGALLGAIMACLAGVLAVALHAAGGRRAVPAPQPASPGATQPRIVRVARPPISLHPGEPPRLDAIAFVDDQHGWAGGYASILATSDGGRTWTPQYTGPDTVLFLDFADASHGWALTERGLLATTDGGRAWSAISLPAAMRQVHFTDASHGFGLALGGDLWTTADGGRSWRPLPSPTPVRSFCFSDPQTGWALIQPGLIHTSDGGAHWQTRLDAPGANGGQLDCPGANNVWLALYGGAGMTQLSYSVFHSADGGATWRTVVATPTTGGGPAPGNPKGGASGPAPAPGPLAAAGASAAYLAGYCNACGEGGTVTIGSTADGGSHWENDGNIPGATPASFALAFPTPGHGWVATTSGSGRASILSSANGGRTWAVRYSAAAATPQRAVAFPKVGVGYGLGTVDEGSAILKSVDGGLQWRKIALLPGSPEPTPAFGPQLTFPDADHGWAVGPADRLFATSDAGQTWTAVPSINRVFAVYFEDRERGCVQTPPLPGQKSAPLLATTDGGVDWQPRENLPNVVTCAASLLDPAWQSTMAALGAQSGPSAPPWRLLDVRGPNAWAWGVQLALSSSDGGRTWVRYNWPWSYDALSLSFADPSDGWLLTWDRRLFRTADGGASWKQIP